MHRRFLLNTCRFVALTIIAFATLGCNTVTERGLVVEFVNKTP